MPSYEVVSESLRIAITANVSVKTVTKGGNVTFLKPSSTQFTACLQSVNTQFVFRTNIFRVLCFGLFYNLTKDSSNLCA